MIAVLIVAVIMLALPLAIRRVRERVLVRRLLRRYRDLRASGRPISVVGKKVVRIPCDRIVIREGRTRGQ